MISAPPSRSAAPTKRGRLIAIWGSPKRPKPSSTRPASSCPVITKPIVAAGISFGAGALLLLVISLAMTRLQGVSSGWRDLPLWTFVAGGLLGVIYLTSAIFLAPRIGAAATMGFVISGQLLAGLVLDVFGLFGLPQIAMSLPRFVGAALLLGGALIMRFA